MFYEFRNRNKTVKELRKDHGFTAQQLADKTGIDKLEILRIDHLKLKEVKEPTRTMLVPLLRGDYMDRA